MALRLLGQMCYMERVGKMHGKGWARQQGSCDTALSVLRAVLPFTAESFISLGPRLLPTYPHLASSFPKA